MALEDAIAALVAGALREAAPDLRGLVDEMKECTGALTSLRSGVLTPDEAAAYLKVSRRKLDDWTAAGEIRVSKNGAVVRYKRDWLDDFVDRCASGGPARALPATVKCAHSAGSSSLHSTLPDLKVFGCGNQKGGAQRKKAAPDS